MLIATVQRQGILTRHSFLKLHFRFALFRVHSRLALLFWKHCREADLRAERFASGAEYSRPGEFLKRVGAKRQK
jgi:hypothetical protein